mgnify:CR=1 FL=1
MKSAPSANVAKCLKQTILAIGFSSLSLCALAHEGHVDKDALLACAEKTLKESCQYSKETEKNRVKVYSGYCQKISHNKICVRTQPIKIVMLEPLAN